MQCIMATNIKEILNENLPFKTNRQKKEKNVSLEYDGNGFLHYLADEKTKRREEAKREMILG